MTTQTLPTEKVHAWPRALVVAAILAGILFAGWRYQTWGDTAAFRVSWIPVAITAVPLLFLRRRQFSYACVVVGVVVLALALQGVFIWVLPAVLILLATTADPRRSPWRARLSVLVATALAVVATAGSAGAVHRSLTSPSAGFVVHSDADFTTAQSAVDRVLTDASGRADDRVLGVSITHADDGRGTTIVVQFEPDLSTNEQEGLRRQLAEVPGVAKVCPWYRDNHLRSAC
ncbi:hypothetical protein FHG89_08795 [Micromonospora orduensis]|uniref:Uncharacterized protein n=1 Tax=Micromonospora orduensis TaxID=1420891 RepID=A0A5C4QVX5_9ACTN|nr:hypothetical protein [Micromonospora orduensis]TNH30225.1 hypothetical protein FHG89_08795 [Micromonospora orduensis]